MSVVRSSKFRHVFATDPTKKELCYEGFRPTNCASEGSFVAANKKFIAVCVEAGGGGSFLVQNVENTGRIDVNAPKVSGHKQYILDLQWNPFNDNMLATCSEDGTIKIWEIPDNGFLNNVDSSKALLSLEYHERRCVQMAWHPIASNVLMSVSQEPKIVVWNLDDGEAVSEITDHPDVIYNASWSLKGDKIVSSCKDKCFRIFDARSGDLLLKTKGHEGSKPQRVIFVMEDKFLFSCGFSKMSERQYAVWKISDSDITKVGDGELDTANGCLIPYSDPDVNMVYVAAKGDSMIRYYELDYEKPYVHFLSAFQSKDAQKSLGMIQKRSVDVTSNELVRFYKLISTNKGGFIKPISFKCPRKSDTFQEDIFPNCISVEPALEADEWFEGKNAEPKRIDMSTLFEGKSKPKVGGGGGLKKGGLKGLKARKQESKVENESPETPSPPSERSSEPTNPQLSRSEDKVDGIFNGGIVGAGKRSADAESVKELREEVETLKATVQSLLEKVQKNEERISAMESLSAAKETDGKEEDE